jgi:bis(5'-nucleosyl)-tetraphosphatase (symmetrical)
MYMIGDLQGCHGPFQRLLQTINFSPSRDTLFLLGDLVNRGPDSLAVLRSLVNMGDAAHCLLGNHDLHLLAIWRGVRMPGDKDTAQHILQAPDAADLMDWLRHRQMAILQQGWLMVHAGVLPQWSAAQTLALAAEVEQVLRTPDAHTLTGFLEAMYGNQPAQWHSTLQGYDRLRVIVNALTRLRFCQADGTMEFASKEGAGHAPPDCMPWFKVPGRATACTPVAFGHWSTLHGMSGKTPEMVHNTLALDTGCVWGGCLTAARIMPAGEGFELITVPCDAEQNALA